jgi:hypothetical protein
MNDNLTNFLKKIDAIDPRTINFEEIELDEQIKEFVININKSNWIYTIFSCQGHHHENKSFTNPYFVFIVDNHRIKHFLFHIYNTMPHYNKNLLNLPGISNTSIILSEEEQKYNNIEKFPLSGGYEFKINPTTSDEHYSIISVYWDEKCIDNKEFYDKLKSMAKEIINNTTHKFKSINCS